MYLSGRTNPCTQGLATARKDIIEIVMLEPRDVAQECALLASVLSPSTVLFYYQNLISRENAQ
jgi:hypothetical protein